MLGQRSHAGPTSSRRWVKIQVGMDIGICGLSACNGKNKKGGTPSGTRTVRPAERCRGGGGGILVIVTVWHQNEAISHGAARAVSVMAALVNFTPVAKWGSRRPLPPTWKRGHGDTVAQAPRGTKRRYLLAFQASRYRLLAPRGGGTAPHLTRRGPIRQTVLLAVWIV